MALTVETKRKFKVGDQELPDPDPNMSVREVIKFYAPQYPEITSCSVPVPSAKNGTFIYTFNPKIEEKG